MQDLKIEIKGLFRRVSANVYLILGVAESACRRVQEPGYLYDPFSFGFWKISKTGGLKEKSCV